MDLPWPVVVAWRWTGRGLAIAGDWPVAVCQDAARTLPGHCPDGGGGQWRDAARTGQRSSAGHPVDTKTLFGQGVGLRCY